MSRVQRKYRFAVIATDVALFTVRHGRLNVLLMKMHKDPYRRAWAIPGGLVRPIESVDRSARRNLLLKAGGRDIFLEQLYTFGRVDRDPFGRVVSVAYYALVAADNLRLEQTKFETAWFPIADLPTLAYDHREMIAKAVERIRAKLGYTNIVYSLVPKEFTLSDLQETYQAILGQPLDKRNFRKKILSLRLVRPTGRELRGSANRPAGLYTFVHRRPQIVSILREQ